MNALVSSMERPKYAPDLDNLEVNQLFQGFNSTTVYWQTCPRDMNYVVVFVYRNQLQTATKRSADFHTAQVKAEAYLRTITYDTTLWSAQIWSRALFNAVRNHMVERGQHVRFSNEHFRGFLNEMSEYGQAQKAIGSRLSGVGVHIVWNMTGGGFIGAFESSAEAVTEAEALATQNPLNKYLICSPTSVIYQPKNIKVEAYQEPDPVA